MILKNLAIAFNVFYAKKEKMYPAYVSKHNSDHEKQVIILMIPNGEGRNADERRRKTKSEGQ